MLHELIAKNNENLHEKFSQLYYKIAIYGSIFGAINKKK